VLIAGLFFGATEGNRSAQRAPVLKITAASFLETGSSSRYGFAQNVESGRIDDICLVILR